MKDKYSGNHDLPAAFFCVSCRQATEPPESVTTEEQLEEWVEDWVKKHEKHGELHAGVVKDGFFVSHGEFRWVN